MECDIVPNCVCSVMIYFSEYDHQQPWLLKGLCTSRLSCNNHVLSLLTPFCHGNPKRDIYPGVTVIGEFMANTFFCFTNVNTEFLLLVKTSGTPNTEQVSGESRISQTRAPTPIIFLNTAWQLNKLDIDGESLCPLGSFPSGPSSGTINQSICVLLKIYCRLSQC